MCRSLCFVVILATSAYAIAHGDEKSVTDQPNPKVQKMCLLEANITKNQVDGKNQIEMFKLARKNPDMITYVVCLFREGQIDGLHVDTHTYVEPERSPTLEMHEKCQIEANILDDQIISENITESFLLAEKDPALKCYHACLLRERTIVNSHGALMYERAIESLPSNVENPREVEKAFKQCANKTGDDFCQNAHNTAKCLAGSPIIHDMKLTQDNSTSPPFIIFFNRSPHILVV